MAEILDGKALAKKVRIGLKQEVDNLKEKGVNIETPISSIGFRFEINSSYCEDHVYSREYRGI